MSSVWSIDIWELSLRLGVALILGGMIGLERELNNHAAGFRTHILVCTGSTLIMLLSIYGFADFVNETNVRIDPARLAAQVISGIGFLGAGTIIRNGLSVTGLTTAASLWVSAGIGLSVGAGFYSGAFVSTFLVLIALFILNKFEKSIMFTKKQVIKVDVSDEPGMLGKIAVVLGENGIQINKVNIMEGEFEDQKLKTILFQVGSTNRQVIEEGSEQLIGIRGVKRIQLEWSSSKKKELVPVEIVRKDENLFP